MPAEPVRRRVLAVVFAALVAACGSDDRTPAIALDDDPLRGTVATVDGGTVDLASFAGGDLVVWFWAPW